MGIIPIAAVATTISRIVQDRAFLRPYLSPMWPKKMPPGTRRKNATANVANVPSSAAVSFSETKNSDAMMVAM